MRLDAVPAFSDNYIWILVDDRRQALIVDPGEAGPVFDHLGDTLAPVGVLLTHHHNDHTGGVPALLQRWPRLPVVAPHDERIGTATQRVGEGDRVAIADWTFGVLDLPGHTRSHIGFVGHDHLFCGDTLFSLGCGRLFEGTPAQMLGCMDKLAALPDGTQVCCGHEYTVANAAFAAAVEPGNSALRERHAQAAALRRAGQSTLPSTLASERACNPFLRTETPAVRAAVADRLGREPANRVETFAELRRWKDGFGA